MTKKEANAPMAKEAEFTQAVVEFAELHGWRVMHCPDGEHMKRIPRTGQGFPDLLMVRGIFLVAAELKVGNGNPQPEQWNWLRALEIAGASVFSWRPSDWEDIECVLT